MAYQRGRYWYRSRRDSRHVLTEYIGSGDVARLRAETENLNQQQRVQERAEHHEPATQERKLDRTLDTIAGQLHSLTETALLASGYHKHSGTWRRARYEQLS